MTTAVADTARVVLEAILPGTPTRVQVSVPGTAYRLELVLDGDAAALHPRVGKRVAGVIRGRAQRVWNAAAGGCFIEPVWGHPRIVQGRVLAVDPDSNAVLLDLAVPAWMTLEASQSAASYQTGDLLNFYCESGVRFSAR
jgi:hypothetical protein